MSVLEGVESSRRMLKPDTVPTVFAFNSPPKCIKLSEAKLAKPEYKAVLTELLGEKELDSTKTEFLEPVAT